jgi:DNA polymerase III alpha subunit (gram-positive type)
MPRYVVFDTETGGLESSTTSLLTAYFGILDENLNLIAELDLALKPESGVYSVTAGALKVNKIDLASHDKDAVPYPQAAVMLANFLRQHCPGPKDKLVPIAHNIPFDYSFVFDKLLEKHLWEEYCSYHSMDTMVIAYYLRLKGAIKTYSLSLGSLTKYFNIEINGELHRAKTDALACVKVLKRMLTI